jgi:phosphomannomutase
MIGEEYTLVSVADYVLAHKPGSCVSNLSSSRALQDIAKKHNCDYHASAVGEVNVVEKMKATKAVIGGEGNGGIIMPDLHYGRDSLIGTALFLTHLVHSNHSCSKLRASLPDYFMAKEKVQLTPDIDVDDILSQMQKDYAHENHTTIDGLKIDFADSWVHFRKSNTEPIIRVYTEAQSQEVADILAQNVIKKIRGKL